MDEAEIERRTRASMVTEAASVLARLHRFGRDDPYDRAQLTVGELKDLARAEVTLQNIIRRLSA